MVTKLVAQNRKRRDRCRLEVCRVREVSREICVGVASIGHEAGRAATCAVLKAANELLRVPVDEFAVSGWKLTGVGTVRQIGF